MPNGQKAHLMKNNEDSPTIGAFGKAIRRVLRPLVRTMIARGWLFPDASDLLKELYVEACTRDFQLGGKRLTDSRVSLLTGLQRRDVKAIRDRLEQAPSQGSVPGAGALPRVMARWMDGLPIALPRTTRDERKSFEALVAEVSRDIHPRTVLDELMRLDLIEHDQDKDMVKLIAQAYVPSQNDDELVGYLGANLGDHAEAAADNLAAAPNPGPYYERAVHYNKLTPEALAQLDALAGQRQSDVLKELSSMAGLLQERDAGKDTATGRFRFGAFVYTDPPKKSEAEE